MSLKSKLHGKTLHSQAWEIVSDLYAYFQHQCQIGDEISTPAYKKELTEVHHKWQMLLVFPKEQYGE